MGWLVPFEHQEPGDSLHTFKYLTESDLETLRTFISEHLQYDEDEETKEFWEEMANKLLLEELHY